MKIYEKIILESLNKKYGRLTIVEIFELDRSEKNPRRKARCICDCGTEKIAVLSEIKNGHTSSCGCLQKEHAVALTKIMHQMHVDSGKVKEPKVGSATQVYRQNYSDGYLSFEQFFDLSQKNCFYCGSPPSNCFNIYAFNSRRYKYVGYRKDEGNFIYNGLDRIDPTKKHSIDNVVACCTHCNTAKLDRSVSDFLQWIETVYNFSIKKINEKPY